MLRQSASRLWASNVTALLIFYQKPAGKLKQHSEKYTFLMRRSSLWSSCRWRLTLVAFCRPQQSAAASFWTRDLAGTTWWSGTTTAWLMPALSSGSEAVWETATSLRARRAAGKPASRSNMHTDTRLTAFFLNHKHLSVASLQLQYLTVLSVANFYMEYTKRIIKQN